MEGPVGLGLLGLVVRACSAAGRCVRQRDQRGSAGRGRRDQARQPPRRAASVRAVPRRDNDRDVADARVALPDRQDRGRPAGPRAALGSMVHRRVHADRGRLGGVDRGLGLRRDGHVHRRRVDARLPGRRPGGLRRDGRDVPARARHRCILRELCGAVPLARHDLGRPVSEHPEVLDRTVVQHDRAERFGGSLHVDGHVGGRDHRHPVRAPVHRRRPVPVQRQGPAHREQLLTSLAVPPSGEQHEIRHGDLVAVITEVGATLRSFSAGGADVLDGFALDEISPAGRGQVLAPWPNRLDGGRYAFEGLAGRAAIDEPELGNAIHGLVRWLSWSATSKTEDGVTLRCALPPQPGYPWRLELELDYRVSSDGLRVDVGAANVSGGRAPFGIGFHPYLTLGVPVDELVLTLPASRRLLTDERALPVGEEEVEGTIFDLRSARTIGSKRLDTCFTGLHRNDDGRWRVRVEGRGGALELWGSEGFGYVQAYTGDTLDPVSRRRRAIAVEPMTCPPNAFATGRDLIALDPGGSWSAAWGIALPGART